MGRGSNNSVIIQDSLQTTRATVTELKILTLEQAPCLYHATKIEQQDSIVESGLLTNSNQIGLTEGGDWAEEYYQTSPIYLSLNPGKSRNINYLKQAKTVFQVDHSQLQLLPDLPGLVDHGGIIDQQGIYWEEGNEPEPLAPFLDDGYVGFKDLLEDQQVTLAAINTTLTAAVTKNISQEMLKLK